MILLLGQLGSLIGLQPLRLGHPQLGQCVRTPGGLIPQETSSDLFPLWQEGDKSLGSGGRSPETSAWKLNSVTFARLLVKAITRQPNFKGWENRLCLSLRGDSKYCGQVFSLPTSSYLFVHFEYSNTLALCVCVCVCY